MSYILDALRKSEHERQMIAGQNSAMLFPLEIKRDHNPWFLPALITVVILVVLTTIWQLWPQPTVTDARNTIRLPETNLAPQPKNLTLESIPEPASKAEKHAPDNAQRKVHSATIRADTSQPSANLETMSGKAHSAGTVANNPTSVDPLIGLPPLNITGYVHNEQSGSLVMINNQLVHEGEELSPGLRLIKILDNSAIFSYKGYVFTR